VQKGAVYPPEAAALKAFDYRGDPEYVIAASPDMVLIRPFVRRQNPSYIAELENAGLLVVSLYPETFDDCDTYIERLGLLTGRVSEAADKLRLLHEDLDEIAARTRTANAAKKPRVFFEATETEARTVAAGSLPARAILTAGGANIAEGAKPLTKGGSIAPFGVERLLSQADDIDCYIIQQGAMNGARDLNAVKARPGFTAIKAVREGRVLFIDEQLISSPTFRYLDGVRAISLYLAAADH
jgi:iron complex transport system substrate-binding protein